MGGCSELLQNAQLECNLSTTCALLWSAQKLLYTLCGVLIIFSIHYHVSHLETAALCLSSCAMTIFTPTAEATILWISQLPHVHSRRLTADPPHKQLHIAEEVSNCCTVIMASGRGSRHPTKLTPYQLGNLFKNLLLEFTVWSNSPD